MPCAPSGAFAAADGKPPDLENDRKFMSIQRHAGNRGGDPHRSLDRNRGSPRWPEGRYVDQRNGVAGGRVLDGRRPSGDRHQRSDHQSARCVATTPDPTTRPDNFSSASDNDSSRQGALLLSIWVRYYRVLLSSLRDFVGALRIFHRRADDELRLIAGRRLDQFHNEVRLARLISHPNVWPRARYRQSLAHDVRRCRIRAVSSPWKGPKRGSRSMTGAKPRTRSLSRSRSCDSR